MKVSTVQFIQSSPSIDKCPEEKKIPEYAFVGRSNVGKSSLINYLTNSKIAKTSSNPGKTQLINHFLINNEWYLVDLPGYGYAKVSKKTRASFNAFTKKYLSERKNLIYVFVLIDVRIKPQAIDLLFMNWLGENKIPFVRIFSKCDKVNSINIKKRVLEHRESLLKSWEEIPEYIISSSKSKIGKDLILEKIESSKNLII
ncbi:MAG: YihA family ribosome biogenesis GTP-binding protein [Flavobacteriales bacterium TMED113]|nr:MAG: YihA family ribosome biogenesis GTP-binding protein [Flavobacteriales bacterium TMED113]